MTAILPNAWANDAAELRAAGTELLRAEEPSLRRVIERYVRDATVADDIFQEVSLKIIRRVHTVREPAALRGWIYQTARNAALDHLRREARRPVVRGVQDIHEAGGELGRNPAEAFLSRERVEAVHRALSRLPKSQREAIELRLHDGLDHVAIAERLGISREAVEVRLCRGRAALKQQLADILGGDL